MLITILCISFGVWGCAYAAVHRYGGRLGYWMLYALAGLGVPAAFTGAFYLVYRGVDPAAAPELAQVVLSLGVIVGVLGFPLNYTRIKAKRDSQD